MTTQGGIVVRCVELMVIMQSGTEISDRLVSRNGQLLVSQVTLGQYPRNTVIMTVRADLILAGVRAESHKLRAETWKLRYPEALIQASASSGCGKAEHLTLLTSWAIAGCVGGFLPQVLNPTSALESLREVDARNVTSGNKC
jgi:hypothetical protein